MVRPLNTIIHFSSILLAEANPNEAELSEAIRKKILFFLGLSF